MKLSRASSVKDVALCVAKALSRAKIASVLTGGACATIYSDGKYQSADLDFILQSSTSQHRLDAAMNQIGFKRRGDQYFHSKTPFFIEFPPGPLAIGGDFRIQPVKYKIGSSTILLLSPTDCCRDRLAAFFHWHDRQSLQVAVQVAVRHPVDLERLRHWSDKEGFSSDFEEFAAELERARGSKRSRARKR